VAILNLVAGGEGLLRDLPPAARLAPCPAKRDLQPLGAQLQRVLFGNTQGLRRLWPRFFLVFPGLFGGFTAVLVLYFKQAFGWGPGLSAPPRLFL